MPDSMMTAETGDMPNVSGNSSAENGSTPLERIKAAFYRMPAHGRYLLNYHMYAPELHALSADARRR